MILNCNSCGKKFVVPDQAITAAGRTVQCGSCGNKWKQFPIKNETKKIIDEKKLFKEKKPIKKQVLKTKKKRVQKKREIDLYSPEYLEKKHGISISKNEAKVPSKEKVSFGFYNLLILFLVIIIAFSKGLYFLQDFIVLYLPVTEFYLDYFFESMRNIFEIWKNLISNY